jgi:hypothetical protein
MNAGSMQNVLVTLIVALSALVALRRILPNVFRRLQSRFSRHLGQARHPRWIRRFGRWVQPSEARQGGCGSGLGCASCAGCVAPTPVGNAIPLVMQPRQTTATR